MYKVFNQSKTIIIIKDAKKINFDESTLFVETHLETDFSRFYQELMQRSDIQTLIFNTSSSEKDVFDEFSKLFKNIAAAGGCIKDEQDRLLMIYRYHKWDLPKGRIEKGEQQREAAIRECEEETGIKDLEIIRELSPTYHIFNHYQKSILKTTYWYLMKTHSNQQLVAQTEEFIEEVKWKNAEGVRDALTNTYPSIHELMKEI